MGYMTQRRISGLVPVMVAGAALCTVPLGGDAGSAAKPAFKLLHGFESPPTNPNAEVIEGSDGALYGTTPSGGAFGYGVVFEVNRDGTGFFELHHFNLADRTDGAYPEARLLECSDGGLYGTASGGGKYGYGIVFKVKKDGTGFATLHDFFGPDPTNGASPRAGLIEGSDGVLYGTTLHGGAYDSGIVFKMGKDGAGFLKLHDFNRKDTANGYDPEGGLLEGSNGVLYGTTASGGVYGDGAGIVYKLKMDGTEFLKLHDFNFFDVENGSRPQSELIEGSDGALYGTTYRGGAHGSGTIFKLTSAIVGFPLHTFQTLHDFDFNDPANGSYPQAGLIEGSDGALYGTTSLGGLGEGGTAFKLNKDGSGFSKLHDFGTGDGAHVLAGVIEGSDGMLYGTTSYGGPYNWGVAFKLATDGAGFQRLHDFGPSVGTFLYSKLLLGSDGALYGTTYRGGAHGSGTIFKLTSASVGFPFHTFQTLHAFDFNDPANGSYPRAGLVEGSDGVLYGTTDYGGGGLDDYGIVFSINRDGSGFRKLHDFESDDGAYVYGGVVEGSDGDLYGTTFKGTAYSGGVVFKVNKDGAGFRTLHSFTVGDYSHAGLVEGSDGALYGTTVYGGVHDSGTVFKVNRDGTGFLTLHDFNKADSADGANPYAQLIEASDGELYGTTRSGGTAPVSGTVFKINRDGSGFLKVYDFDDASGGGPMAGVIERADGALYGTTVGGGAYDAGTVFKVNKNGTGFLTLHSFNGGDGAGPSASLVQGSRGALYGTTYGGGPSGGGGVVFSLVMPPADGNANLVPTRATSAPPRP